MKNEQNKKGKKKNAYLLLLLVLLLGITVGFATLSATLTINGTSKINSSTQWDVSPDPDDPDKGVECPSTQVCTINPQDPTNVDPDDGKPVCTDPEDPTTCTDPVGAVIWTEGDTVNFKHILNQPGDVFTFDVTYKNTGSIDAKLASVSKTTLTGTAAQFLTYDVTHVDGSAIAEDEPLAAGASVTYRVTVTYIKNIAALPTTDQLAEIHDTTAGRATTFTAVFEQA